MAEPDAYAQRQMQFMGVVRARLAEMGRTQIDLADDIGVTPQLIRAWNSGRRRLPARRIPGIAEFVGGDPDDMWPGWQDEQLLQNRAARPTAADRIAKLEAALEAQGRRLRSVEAQIAAERAEREAAIHDFERIAAERDGVDAVTELELELESEAQRLEARRAADAEARPARRRRGQAS